MSFLSLFFFSRKKNVGLQNSFSCQRQQCLLLSHLILVICGPAHQNLTHTQIPWRYSQCAFQSILGRSWNFKSLGSSLTARLACRERQGPDGAVKAGNHTGTTDLWFVQIGLASCNVVELIIQTQRWTTALMTRQSPASYIISDKSSSVLMLGTWGQRQVHPYLCIKSSVTVQPSWPLNSMPRKLPISHAFSDQLSEVCL